MVTVTFKLISFFLTDLSVFQQCIQHGNCRRSFQILCPLLLFVSLCTLQNRHIEKLGISPWNSASWFQWAHIKSKLGCCLWAVVSQNHFRESCYCWGRIGSTGVPWDYSSWTRSYWSVLEDDQRRGVGAWDWGLWASHVFLPVWTGCVIVGTHSLALVALLDQVT